MMPRFTHKLLAFGLALGLALLAVASQSESTTAPLAKELTDLLQQRKLDAVAARLGPDTFVAALYYPGSELLVVSAKYAAPALLNEKILTSNYRDVYMDLTAASIVESKLMVEDSNGDGIRSDPGKEAFDIVTRATAVPLHLDGEWKKQNMTEEAYLKAYRDAETAYRAMLEGLVAELKKPH